MTRATEEAPDKMAFAALVEPVYQLFVSQTKSDKYLNMVKDFVGELK